MGTYTLGPSDITTLNDAADLAVKAAKAAAREAAKACLEDAERIAQTRLGYAEEAKTFLADVQRGQAQLSSGHVDALAAGMQLLYTDVRKIRDRELKRLVNTEGAEVRCAEIRATFAKLRVKGQLDIEDSVKRDAAADEAAAGQTTLVGV
jgi:hypothetical protein